MSDDRPSFQHNLRQLIRARFPLLYIQTAEEGRALAAVISALADRSVRTRDVYTWTVTNGLAEIGKSGSAETRRPSAAVTAAASLDLAAVVIFFDLHPWLGSAQQPADADLVRRLRDLTQQYRDGTQPRMIILVSPELRIPVELQNSATVLNFPLPDEALLFEHLSTMIEANSASAAVRIDVDEATRHALARAALGLTLTEAENAFARAMADDNALTGADLPTVLAEKRQIIRRSGVLELVDSDLRLADIGGLANLKNWLVKRTGSWSSDAARWALPAPKGLLVTGVPGCGKSMTAKAIAAAWSIPLIRLDVGRVFAGLVGASEENMRTALAVAEAISPCVLWIDEIEKGFSSATGERDSGTSARVFGSFLTWMQERTAPVFVMATANDISKLPPEFLRKGRFDEIFFIDLPTVVERVDIFELHLRRRLRSGPALGEFPVTDELLRQLADATEGFTGAEIEQAVIAACFEAFDGRRELHAADLLHSIETTVPLSVTQAEEIGALRAWADVRAVSASTIAARAGYLVPAPESAPEPDPAAALLRGGRPIEI